MNQKTTLLLGGTAAAVLGFVLLRPSPAKAAPVASAPSPAPAPKPAPAPVSTPATTNPTSTTARRTVSLVRGLTYYAQGTVTNLSSATMDAQGVKQALELKGIQAVSFIDTDPPLLEPKQKAVVGYSFKVKKAATVTIGTAMKEKGLISVTLSSVVEG